MIRPNSKCSRGDLAGLLLLITLTLPGCQSTEFSGPAHTVRAVAECVNRIGMELEIDGHILQLNIRYPREQVFIVGTAGGMQRKDVFDYVYTNCPVDIVNGFPLFFLKRDFEESFPGHPLATAVRLRKGTVHFRTTDKYMFFARAPGLGAGYAASALGVILRSDAALAEGYLPVVRMRQHIDGQWHDSRRFAMDSFMYYVAPTDTVSLEFSAFLLRISYYADRVVVSQAAPGEVEGLRVLLKEGLNEIPIALKQLDGVELTPGLPWRLSFSYRDFRPNADIDVHVIGQQRSTSGGSVHLNSGLDFFPSMSLGESPTGLATLGSPTFRVMTRRSPLLDRALELGLVDYPSKDDRFPEWVREEYYGRFPHRLPAAGSKSP